MENKRMDSLSGKALIMVHATLDWMESIYMSSTRISFSFLIFILSFIQLWARRKCYVKGILIKKDLFIKQIWRVERGQPDTMFMKRTSKQVGRPLNLHSDELRTFVDATRSHHSLLHAPATGTLKTTSILIPFSFICCASMWCCMLQGMYVWAKRSA